MIRPLDSLRVIDLERRRRTLQLQIKEWLRRGLDTDSLVAVDLELYEAINRKVYGAPA